MCSVLRSRDFKLEDGTLEPQSVAPTTKMAVRSSELAGWLSVLRAVR